MSFAERGAQLAALALALGSVAAIGKLADPRAVDAPAVAASALPAAAPSASSASSAPGRAAGVAVRLVDRLKSAQVELPELGRTDEQLQYWRRMRSPYFGPGGDLSAAVQQVALVREGSKRQAAPGGWVLDPKVWNMSEGSYDQRESILAPPPGKLRFPALAVPPGAVFETAPAIAGPGMGGAEFEVAVRGPDGVRVVLGTRFVEGGYTGAFSDWELSLEPWAGKSIELELTTRSKVRGVVPPAAFWGTPRVLAPGASDLPFNVLFIVVDALRGDALSSAHDDDTDRAIAAAKLPPLDARLPNLPEVAPHLDRLAKEGVHFTRAYSGGTWTRPGTLAMLSGAHSSDLGISPLALVPQPADVRAMYARRPPFLPLLFRERGALTHAVVNNFYIVGYAGVGVDVGFEGLVDHRFNRDDTAEIVRDTLQLMDRHRARRFMLFVNLASPHSPFQPPPAMRAAIPRPPRGPADRLIRDYLAEIRKDDAAIGELLARVDQLGLRDDTLVVVTADHGETLSREHDVVPEGVDGGPRVSGRFHHLSTLFDETAHVPLIFRLPKKLPSGVRVKDPVSALDLVPTVLSLAEREVPPGVTGSSLLPLASGKSDPERPVVVEGRAARSIRVGRWRLVMRDESYRRVWVRGAFETRAVELYDLETDPGERAEISAKHPDVVERLQRADRERRSRAAPVSDTQTTCRLRFTGGGERRRVTATIKAPGQKLGVAARDLHGGRLQNRPDGVVLDIELPAGSAAGLDVTAAASVDLEWTFQLDGQPWPKTQIYAGELGLSAEALVDGVRGASARRLAAGARLPFVDTTSDPGLYVVCDRQAREIELRQSDAAKDEAMGLMKAWGYVR